MGKYKEFGHKGGTVIMQEVTHDGNVFFIDAKGKVHEKKEGLPLVKDKEIIKAVKKAAE